MDVTLPNGTVIENVPETATKEEIKQKAIAAGLAKESDFPSAQPAKPPAGSITSGLLMGMKDPISGGAQLLEKVLPEGVVRRVNQLNQFLAEKGLVAPLPQGGVSQMVKEEEAAYQQARKAEGEDGFDFSRLAGNILSPVNLAAGYRAASLAGARPVAAAAAAGASQAALTPVLTEEDFAAEKVKQTLLGGAVGAGGQKVTTAVSKAFNPLASKAEQTMRELGVKLTPGQTLGGQFNTIEEIAANLPLVGKYVSGARERSLFSFNAGVINKALAKVDDKLPDQVIGRDAVQYAKQVVDSKYDEVLKDLTFRFDPGVYNRTLAVLKKANLPKAEQRVQIDDEVKKLVASYFQGKGTIDGPAYKTMESDLYKRAKTYLASNTTSDKDIGEALMDVLGVLKDSLKAQNKNAAKQLSKVNDAYADISVMRTAAANTAAVNGVFSPKQYAQAVRMKDKSLNKARFGEGLARGQETADAAVEVMGETGKSSLETRFAAAGAGGFGFYTDPTTAAALIAITPAMYSESGVKVMDKILRQRPEIAKQIGRTLEKRASKEGSITATQILQEYQKASRTLEENEPTMPLGVAP